MSSTSPTWSRGVAVPSPGPAPLRVFRRALLFSPFLLLAFLSFLMTAARADTPMDWRQLNVTGPSARYWMQMTYDSARDRVVLFGGANASVFLGDTWEWDGEKWTLVATSGPSPRGSAAMVYDAARGKVMLFGGTDSPTISTFYNDTWTWDGSQWTKLEAIGPSPRYNAAMAYDSAREKVVLVGGGSANPNGLTWEWDGSKWTHPPGGEPSYRGACAVAYDSAHQKTVLFGGGGGPGLGDTWTWDGVHWTRVATTGPAPRYSSMVYDSARGKCVLFGGNPDMTWTKFYDDTWEWDGSAWTQVAVTGPSARTGMAIAYDSKRKQVILFGGGLGVPATAIYSDTWVYEAIAVPFTLEETVHALQCAAGLMELSESDRTRCDVESGGTSAGCVDMLDACRIARKVAGLEPNP